MAVFPNPIPKGTPAFWTLPNQTHVIKLTSLLVETLGPEIDGL